MSEWVDEEENFNIFVMSAAFNSNMMCVCVSVHKKRPVQFLTPPAVVVYIQHSLCGVEMGSMNLPTKFTVNFFSSVWQHFLFKVRIAMKNCIKIN